MKIFLILLLKEWKGCEVCRHYHLSTCSKCIHSCLATSTLQIRFLAGATDGKQCDGGRWLKASLDLSDRLFCCNSNSNLYQYLGEEAKLPLEQIFRNKTIIAGMLEEEYKCSTNHLKEDGDVKTLTWLILQSHKALQECLVELRSSLPSSSTL